MIQGKIRPTQTSVSLPSIYSPERREAMTKLCLKALTGKKKKKRGWQRMHQRGAMNGESEQESRRKKIYSQDLRNE